MRRGNKSRGDGDCKGTVTACPGHSGKEHAAEDSDRAAAGFGVSAAAQGPRGGCVPEEG